MVFDLAYATVHLEARALCAAGVALVFPGEADFLTACSALHAKRQSPYISALVSLQQLVQDGPDVTPPINAHVDQSHARPLLRIGGANLRVIAELKQEQVHAFLRLTRGLPLVADRNRSFALPLGGFSQASMDDSKRPSTKA